MTASPMVGSSRKNSVLRAWIVTWLPSLREGLRQFDRHHRRADDASRSGSVSLASASVEVQ